MRRMTKQKSYVRTRIDETSTVTPTASYIAPADPEQGAIKLQLQETFDNRLAYKLRVRTEDERAKANYEFHRKYLSKIKFVVVALYIFILPLIETPYWCLDKVQKINHETF